MRVLHIIRTLDPAIGGPPYVAMRLAEAQAQLGHDVHLACYGDGDRTEWDAAYGRIPGCIRFTTTRWRRRGVGNG